MCFNTFSGQDTSPSLPLPGIHRHRLPGGFQNVPPQFTFHILLPLCCHQKSVVRHLLQLQQARDDGFRDACAMHLKNLSNHVNQMSFRVQAQKFAACIERAA